MVTGIEIAGIVLGTLPLVVEGLEVYQRGVKRLKRSITYDVSLKKLIRQVTEQKIFLEDNLKILLGAACSQQVFTPSLTDDYWNDVSIGPTAEAVKKYLGEKKHQLFQDLLEDFERCLVQLADDLDRVQRVKKSLATFYKPQGKHATKRVMYLIKEEDVKALTAELASLNTSMDTLVRNATILHKQQNTMESRVIPDERKALALAFVLNQIRGYTDRLFQAFHSALVPGCHPSHDVALFLDTPSFPVSRQLGLKPGLFRFRLMLNVYTLDVMTTSVWHEAHVTVSDEDDSPISSPPPGASIVPTAPLGPPSISITAPSSDPSLAQVGHLCSEFIGANQAKVSLDLLLRYEQLLCSQIRISPSEKVKLAFKLATALLQLKTSQWLQTPFSNQAIYFHKVALTGDRYSIKVDQPLVLQSFSNAIQHRTSEKNPKTMFLELGILLLEIWNETLFAVFAEEWCQKGPIQPMMRQGIASEWYERTFMGMSRRYGRVVQICVNFAFEYNQGQQLWDDEDLRKSVCAKIISPLDEECRSFPT
ncbi:hypothetical protein BDW59DRAFT_165135 [Aspergillus cavernicola]|uniref:DUF7580 domain-containing protein n=1 Tax=Aspergillus cavernicola TaxID=176166 RepID=A0ABR4HV76_9EURO